MKQNLQIKTFLGTSVNTVKSQIYVALISYLLVELINRSIAKKTRYFSNLVQKIRICLVYYLSLNYACNKVVNGAKKIRSGLQLQFSSDLFSASF
jgi:hypothetical protein